MSGRWAGSNRRAQLPDDWPRRVAATKAAAGGRCQADQHDPRCDGTGHECDHRTDPHNHDDLQWLNTWCHKAKTQREAQAKGRRRPRTEPHPGRIT